MKNKPSKTASPTSVSVFLVSKVEACSDARLNYDHVAKNFIDEIVEFVNVKQHPSKKCITADTVDKTATKTIFVLEVTLDRKFQLFKTDGKNKKLIEYGSSAYIIPPLPAEIDITTTYQISGHGNEINDWEFTGTQFTKEKSALCQSLKVVNELGSWNDTAETESPDTPPIDFKGRNKKAHTKTYQGDIEIPTASAIARYATIREDGKVPVTPQLPPKENVDFRELSRKWNFQLDVPGADKELIKNQILADFDTWGKNGRLVKSMKTVEAILAIRKLDPKLREQVNLPPDHPKHIPYSIVLRLARVPMELQEEIFREAKADGPRELNRRLLFLFYSTKYRDKIAPE